MATMGGATGISIDGGKNWSTQNNQPTAQFYHVTADNDFPSRVYGTQQGTILPSASPPPATAATSIARIGTPSAVARVAMLPSTRAIHTLFMPASYFGYITRLDRRTKPNAKRPAVATRSRRPQRFRAKISLHLDHAHRFFSARSKHSLSLFQYLFRSKDGGHSWETISGDLTRNDPTKQQDSGGPITKDQASIEFYDLIFTVAESPKQKGLIWVGTGRWPDSTHAGRWKTWNKVTPKGFPNGP